MDPHADLLESGSGAAVAVGSASPRRRAEIAVVGALLVLAALAWVGTAQRMSGMDDGPGADPGGFGSFLLTWILMTAAMMLPAIAAATATIAVSRTGIGVTVQSRPAGQVRAATLTGVTALLLAEYLAVWIVVGMLGYGVLGVGRALGSGFFAWDRAGRGVVVIVLLVAALYQLTPVKRASLRHCRRPTGPAGRSAPGSRTTVRDGLELGGWCLACACALMASLFALGLMSLQWMALITVLLTAERILPRPTAVRMVGAAVLAALAIGIAVAPAHVPGLTIPGSAPMMQKM